MLAITKGTVAQNCGHDGLPGQCALFGRNALELG